ncbi:MAG: type IV secretory system conjugative DNA transfer family protein, partial [Lachnospiraceae bacterium]|nr:type IV secretory system conjugative DNA transfer family protein [Lachnospiraceae bacterium]
MKIEKVHGKAKVMEDINTSEVGHGLVQLFNEFLANKKRIRRLILVDIIIAAIIPQFFFQWALCTLGIRDSISLSKILKNAFTIPGFLLILVFFVVLMGVQFRFYRMYKKDYYIDENGNQVMKTSSPYGKEHWQFEEERQECFLMETDVNKLDETILGIDEHNRVYGLRPDLKGLNKNVMLIGSPGCGKSEAIIKNAIFQAIKRGESATVTDSKGDLYAETAQIAKEEGYIVKVLNLKALELKNSDGCHFLKSLSGDDADSCAETIANTIIANTGDGHMDYFADNEMNLLKALLLYVTSDPGLVRAGRDNLAEVFNIVSTNNADSLEEMFMSLSDDEPAKQAFNIFYKCEPKVRGQIINGMGIRLGLLSNKYVKKICSEDEIDLTLPMKRKCLYYVVISDTDRAYKFIATLFFALCFIEQINYSDSLSQEAKIRQLAVNYFLDEFYATGAIPDFETKCSTVRSRKISIMVCLQNIGQIQFMYPDKLYNSVLSAMTIKMLLGAGDEETAKFFSTMLGNQT